MRLCKARECKWYKYHVFHSEVSHEDITFLPFVDREYDLDQLTTLYLQYYF